MRRSKMICRAAAGALAVAALALSCGCSNERSQAGIDLPDEGPAVATIDGERVPRSLYLAVARAYRLDASKPDGREQAIRRLTDLVLLAHMAKREDFAAKPAFAAQVEMSRLQGIAAATMQALQDRAHIDEAAIKATYDRQAATSGKQEYDFTQLLFADEDLALKAEGELVDGKPFADVFDSYRNDALQARSFDGVQAGQLPEGLARAIDKLSPGESTHLPVHTKFGWHVVQLDKLRPFQPPPLASVEDGIRRSLVRNFAETRLATMREGARIELNASALDAAGAAAAPAPADGPEPHAPPSSDASAEHP